MNVQRRRVYFYVLIGAAYIMLRFLEICKNVSRSAYNDRNSVAWLIS
jgi:hypothetical protein